MNPKYQKLLDLMKEYDECNINDPKRTELGSLIDQITGKYSERDLIKIKIIYEEMKGKK